MAEANGAVQSPNTGTNATGGSPDTFSPHTGFTENVPKDIKALFNSAVSGEEPVKAPVVVEEKKAVVEEKKKPVESESKAKEEKEDSSESVSDKMADIPDGPIEKDPTFKSGEASKAFKEIKAQKKEIEAKIVPLTKERDEYKSKAEALEKRLETAVPRDYEVLKKQNEELLSTLERVNVESSPRFKAAYDNKLDTTIEQMKTSLAGVEGFDTDKFIKVLKSADSADRTAQLDDALAALTPLQQGRVGTKISQYEELLASKSKALEEHKNWVAEQNFNETEQSKQALSQYHKAFDVVMQESEASVPFLKMVEGQEEWNSQVLGIKNKIKETWSRQHQPKELAELTRNAVLLPVYAHYLERTQEEVKALREELQGIQKATASISSGSETAAPSSLNINDIFKNGAGFNG